MEESDLIDTAYAVNTMEHTCTLYNSCNLLCVFFSENMSCDAKSFMIYFIKIPIPFLMFSLLVKFNDPFCRIGLALTMTSRVSKTGWFGSWYIKKVQFTIYLLFKCKLKKWYRCRNKGLKNLQKNNIFSFPFFHLIKICLTKTFHSIWRKGVGP